MQGPGHSNTSSWYRPKKQTYKNEYKLKADSMPLMEIVKQDKEKYKLKRERGKIYSM